MTAEIFVKSFQGQAPDIKQFKELGLPHDYIEKALSMYSFKKKKSGMGHKDSLLDLVANYDLGSVEIGMLTFKDEIEEDDNYYYV